LMIPQRCISHGKFKPGLSAASRSPERAARRP
jgi:hypothetical protein